MNQYLFLAGRIRALESKLLSPAQIDRMIGAASPEAAFRVLTELQYAEYIDTETKAQNFSAILDQGLRETKTLIDEGTEQAKDFDFFWKEYDLNNLKRAIKEKIVEGKTREDIEPISEEIFSEFGNIPTKDILDFVFEEKSPESVPGEYQKIAPELADIYAQNEEFSVVEQHLDKAHFSYLSTLAREVSSSFLRDYITLQIDATNLRTIVRLFVAEKEITTNMFLEGGKISTKELGAAKDIAAVAKLCNQVEYFELETGIKKIDLANKEQSLFDIEALIGHVREHFLCSKEQGEIGTLQVPVWYFIRRCKDAAILKFIMLGKMYNLAPETIYQKIKTIT